jgi:hypothetical protein
MSDIPVAEVSPPLPPHKTPIKVESAARKIPLPLSPEVVLSAKDDTGVPPT